MTHYYDRVYLAEPEYPREDAINAWLESKECSDWIAAAVDTLVGGKDVIWSQSGRRNIGIFAHQLHEMIADEFSTEWQDYCHACLLDHQQRTDDSKQTKELAWSALNTVMRYYAFQIVSDRAAEYAAHLIDNAWQDAEDFDA